LEAVQFPGSGHRAESCDDLSDPPETAAPGPAPESQLLLLLRAAFLRPLLVHGASGDLFGPLLGLPLLLLALPDVLVLAFVLFAPALRHLSFSLSVIRPGVRPSFRSEPDPMDGQSAACFRSRRTRPGMPADPGRARRAASMAWGCAP